VSVTKKEEGDAMQTSCDGLERELADSRKRLRTVLEEHQISLEELKATNEELQSAHEKLEVSNEELRSMNEALQSANAALNAKIEELDRANGELANLHESLQIAMVFLDKDLLIRRFTAASSEVLNLIPADRGRPLTDISSTLALGDLEKDLRTVLREQTPIERRVSRGDGSRHYLMRIRPFWTVAKQLDGVFITFFDVSQSVRAEQRQRTLVSELNHRVRNMLATVIAIARQSARYSASPELFIDDFVGRIQALSQAYTLVARESWGDVLLSDLIKEEMATFRQETGDRATLSGPQAWLKPRAALAFGLVFHELVTNAVRFGSLSSPAGRVGVSWAVEPYDGRQALHLSWRERGGPEVGEPARRGFGTQLIRREVEHDLDGSARIDFAPTGVEVVLTVPLNPDLLRLGGASGSPH
jgi:two-component system CheB/CheR fusion protein